MTAHSPRIAYEQFVKEAPATYAALLALGKSVDETGLDKALTEIVKIRASQMNGCAFCVQYHLNIARKLGVAGEKLDLVAVWRDAGVFDARERAALAWAERVTGLGPEATSDAAYDALRLQFSEAEALFLTIAIGTINQWNRIAVAMRFAPPIPPQAATTA